jgi:hypothetical protein
VAAIAIIIVGGSFLLPDQASFSRSAEIAAPPEKVFAIVASLKRFREYSPWAELHRSKDGLHVCRARKRCWAEDELEFGREVVDVNKGR